MPVTAHSSERLDDALLLILTTELLPAVRSVADDLGGDHPDSLVHARPAGPGPTKSVAALVNHLCGMLTSWGRSALAGENVTRDRDAEFGFTGPVAPEIDRLADLINRLPEWVDIARTRGSVANPVGVRHSSTTLAPLGRLPSSGCCCTSSTRSPSISGTWKLPATCCSQKAVR